jgi:hypothetical protein
MIVTKVKILIYMFELYLLKFITFALAININ